MSSSCRENVGSGSDSPDQTPVPSSSKAVITRLEQSSSSSAIGVDHRECDSSSSLVDAKEDILTQLNRLAMELGNGVAFGWMSPKDWFEREYDSLYDELATADYSASRCLLFNKEHLFSLFEEQNKILLSSYWYKNLNKEKELSKDDLYYRAYQLALLKFAKQCRISVIPVNIFETFTCWNISRIILNKILTRELIKISDGQLNDIVHYARSLLEMVQYIDIKTITDRGKKIVDHLKSAIELSQFPMALMDLADLYLSGVDPSLTLEASKLEAEKCYRLAAGQGITSAHKDLELLKPKPSHFNKNLAENGDLDDEADHWMFSTVNQKVDPVKKSPEEKKAAVVIKEHCHI